MNNKSEAAVTHMQIYAKVEVLSEQISNLVTRLDRDHEDRLRENAYRDAKIKELQDEVSSLKRSRAWVAGATIAASWLIGMLLNLFGLRDRW